MKVKIINQSTNALPSLQTKGSAGYDLCAFTKEIINIEPGKTALISTGLYLEMPNTIEAQIRPRSGLALKYGISILNAPGTIDSDYRGEIKVLLINHGENTFEIKNGDRIAQMVFAQVCHIEFELDSELTQTERGKGGYGHTGI